jgi:hypothetical protein
MVKFMTRQMTLPWILLLNQSWQTSTWNTSKGYADYVFAIWAHSKEEVHNFIRNLSKIHPNIMFTMETGK